MIAETNKNKSFNRLQVTLSAVSHFITDIYQAFIVGLIPLLTIKFGLSLFQIALLTATSVIANSFFSPVFGFFSDRHGIKYFLIIGPLVTSVFLSLLGIIPNYYLLIICLFIGNLGIAAYHPASAAVAGYFGGSRKAVSSSIINFGGNFGNALGVLIIILIVENIDMKFTPAAMIPGIIIVIVLLKYAFSSVNKSSRLSIHRFTSKLKSVSRKKIYLLGLILFCIYTLYILWITLFTYMPLYYTGMGLPLISAGAVMFLFNMLGGAAGMISGWLFDRFKKGIYIIQAGFISAIPLLYFTFRAPATISIFLFILGGIFLISVQPVCIRLTQDLLPGSMSFASSLILGFAPGLAGITMIFLGKAADRIGINMLVHLELILAAFTVLVLFIFAIVSKMNLLQGRSKSGYL
ncbi:MAG: MFS transporter [Actinobacteria bacterium]|nr:MFS transporter [Actinomycetota bacterium]